MSKTNIYATKSYRLGDSGENKVILKLNTFNNPDFNIHNIMLKDGDTTHQIDVISITPAGVFVIEVKNVCGYKVYCENDWKYWTYDWIKDKKLIKCTLYNPIWQNETHVFEIRKILGPDFPVYSMVVFANNNMLIHERDLNEMVIPLKQLETYMSKFPPNKLSDAEMMYIKTEILRNHHPEIKLQEHIDNVQRIRT